LCNRVTSGKTVCEQEVLSVGGDGLSVGAVGGVSLDLVNKVLVEVDLADMVGGEVVNGTILTSSGVRVDSNVNVDGATSVMTREVGQELDSTVGVSLLESTVEGVVQVLRGRREVTTRWNTCINTGRVAVYFVSV